MLELMRRRRKKNGKSSEKECEAANDLLWAVGFIAHPHAISNRPNMSTNLTRRTMILLLLFFFLLQLFFCAQRVFLCVCVFFFHHITFQCYTNKMPEIKSFAISSVPQHKRTDKLQNRVSSHFMQPFAIWPKWFVRQDQIDLQAPLSVD